MRDGLYYVFAAIVRIRISGLDQEAEGVWVMTSKCLGHNSTYSPIRTTIHTIAIVCIGEYTLLANTYYCDPQPPGPDRKCEYVLLQRIRSTIHLSTLTLKSEVSLSSLTLSKISICPISHNQDTLGYQWRIQDGTPTTGMGASGHDIKNRIKSKKIVSLEGKGFAGGYLRTAESGFLFKSLIFCPTQKADLHNNQGHFTITNLGGPSVNSAQS